MPFDYKAAKMLVEEKFGGYGSGKATADAMGVTREHLFRLLAGEIRNPTLKTIESLAEVLGCDITDLIDPKKPAKRKRPRTP